jgi:hypothetical protein
MKTRPDHGARALLRRLDETAFFADYSLLGDGNIRHYDWEKLGAKMTGLEKGLWRFLLLGETMPVAEVKEMLGSAAMQFLIRHKLCLITGGKASMGDARLLRYWGRSFFIERGIVALSYVGEDTKALAATVPQMTEGRCLSLYTAGGLEVLPLAAGSNVKINFASLKASPNVLRANLELAAGAEAPERWQFSSNGAGSYDLIVSSPPSCFQPAGMKMAKFASGGPDGLRCVRKVLEAASTELAPDGLALTTFIFFAEAEAAPMERKLRAFLDTYGLDYLVAVSSKLLMEPGVPVFNLLVASYVLPGTPDMAKVMGKTMAHIRKHNFGAAHLVKARLWKPRGKTPERQIVNYSDSYYGMWTI